MIRPTRLILLGATVALLQSGVLYGMVRKHALILRHGTEVTLLTEPIDPHDLLRGDYVNLGYAISTIEAERIDGTRPNADGPADIYVMLKPGVDGTWTFNGAHWQKHSDVTPGEVELRGRTSSFANPAPHSRLSVTYGIERYYVPETQGRTIEEEQHKRELKAVIAVSNGDAQIKTLKLGEKVLYEEPLY